MENIMLNAAMHHTALLAVIRSILDMGPERRLDLLGAVLEVKVPEFVKTSRPALTQVMKMDVEERMALLAELIVEEPGMVIDAVHQLPSSDHDAEYRELIDNGRKIQAIKLYRDRNNEGLRESKDYIDGLAERMQRP